MNLQTKAYNLLSDIPVTTIVASLTAINITSYN